MNEHQVEAAIEIDAPLDEVWAVMTDLAAYAEWNPFIYGVDGVPAALDVGARFVLRVRWSDGKTVRSREHVVAVEPPAGAAPRRALLAYRFGGPLPALYLVRATRHQWLEQDPGGPTRYRTREVFHGLLSRFVPFAPVRDGFERHARALKQRAESLAAGRAK